MNEDEIAQRLLDNGFTVKESRFIKYWVKKERSTYKIILMQLRRVFIGGVLMRLLATAMLFISYVIDGFSGFYGSLLAYVFSIVVCEFFAPIKVGAKVFIHYKKLFS